MSQKDYIIKCRFEELFRKCFVVLCYFADKYSQDIGTSKKIVHGVFLDIWNRRESFDFDNAAKSYLYTAVYNGCMKNKYTEADDVAAKLIHDTGTISDVVETVELEKKVTDAVEKLPEKCKEAFKLNRYFNMKNTKIAAKLNVSVKTVDVQVSKAFKILRNELSDYLIPILLLLICIG